MNRVTKLVIGILNVAVVLILVGALVLNTQKQKEQLQILREEAKRNFQTLTRQQRELEQLAGSLRAQLEAARSVQQETIGKLNDAIHANLALQQSLQAAESQVAELKKPQGKERNDRPSSESKSEILRRR